MAKRESPFGALSSRTTLHIFKVNKIQLNNLQIFDSMIFVNHCLEGLKIFSKKIDSKSSKLKIKEFYSRSTLTSSKWGNF